ncbi:MAG: arsenate reductase (glutaredoxin) [Fidelibacterota bacterium]
MIIYHNPRCRKSRETLARLQAAGVEPKIVKYLETPPTENGLRDLAQKLNLRPKDFIRRGEADYKTLNLKEKLDDDDALFHAMATHPKLIERPIVVKGNRAILGRPPEKVDTLLP